MIRQGKPEAVGAALTNLPTNLTPTPRALTQLLRALAAYGADEPASQGALSKALLQAEIRLQNHRNNKLPIFSAYNSTLVLDLYRLCKQACARLAAAGVNSE
jgi:outer membrane PBP1 activator LpoA protein